MKLSATILEHYRRLAWHERLALIGAIASIIGLYGLYPLLTASPKPEPSRPDSTPPPVSVQKNGDLVQAPTIVINNNIPGSPVTPAVQDVTSRRRIGGDADKAPHVTNASSKALKGEDVSSACHTSQSQSLREVLREAEWYYRQQLLQDALNRYRCAHAKLPENLAPQIDRTELRRALDSRNESIDQVVATTTRVRQWFDAIDKMLPID